jgi:hypothetical protein
MSEPRAPYVVARSGDDPTPTSRPSYGDTWLALSTAVAVADYLHGLIEGVGYTVPPPQLERLQRARVALSRVPDVPDDDT